MTINKQNRERVKKIIDGRIPKTNIAIAKTLICFAMCCFAMLVLFSLGLLNSKSLLVYASFIISPVLFIIASVWCFIKKGEGKAFQYIFITLLILFWFILDLMSGYKTKMLLPILIVLSLRYYNKKLTAFTYIISSVFMLFTVWCNAYLYTKTGFIDLNVVSFDKTYNISFQGFIFNNIINLNPSSKMLFSNGMQLTFFPNFIFLTAITIISMRFMKENLINIIKAEEITESAANQRIELADMKTKIMLSQIKPHFIYNTLTTISYFCSENPQKAEELTNRFSEYLRSNLSSLTETESVDFKKELEAIKNYLEIEKIRFDERINVEYNINVSDFPVPVLSIQPIVENAVKHGICKKEDGGTIKISTFDENDSYVIKVEDDGVGFNEDTVEFDGKEHVGVKNIVTRIENYGGKISIESIPDVGTTVIIRLPKEGNVC